MINWENFNDTYQHYGNEVVVQIIDMFAEDYQNDMKLIAQAIEDKDFPALKFSAHHIKGSILNFMDMDTAALAHTLEQKGEKAMGEGAAEALAALQPAVDALMLILLEHKKKIAN
jgi:HPt (histidine-containing phosphotransfer) domain-containing protein